MMTTMTTRRARIPSGQDALSRSTTREVHQSLFGLQDTLEKLQARLDQADIAIEVAVEDPGVFVRSPQALKNLEDAMRSVTGLCDKIIGHLGMIHHTLKEVGFHPGPSGLYRLADRVAMRWLVRQHGKIAFNKYNPSELLGQLKRVLLDAGLDEVWQQVEAAKVPRMINDAWQNRERA